MASPENPLPAELERIYANRFDADQDYRNQVWRVLIQDWFQRYIPPNASVLDLGCGYGQFINQVECARKYGMDLNPASRSKLNPDVQFLEENCAETWSLPNDSLDIVFTSNFFEHLYTKRDLARSLAEARRCLKPGGRTIAMGPNIKFAGGAYWDFFDHHLALTESSLKEACETAGFHTQFVWDRFLPYTMVNARKYPMVFLRTYLRLPILWKLAGKQFLVIAAK